MITQVIMYIHTHKVHVGGEYKGDITSTGIKQKGTSHSTMRLHVRKAGDEGDVIEQG